MPGQVRSLASSTSAQYSSHSASGASGSGRAGRSIKAFDTADVANDINEIVLVSMASGLPCELRSDLTKANLPRGHPMPEDDGPEARDSYDVDFRGAVDLSPTINRG